MTSKYKSSRDFHSPQPKTSFSQNNHAKSTTPFSIDRTFSASSTDFRESCDMFDEDHETMKLNHSTANTITPSSPYLMNPSSSTSPHYNNIQETYFDDTELSLGHHDNGMVDIEGNVIRNMDNVCFGQDDVDDDDNDDLCSIDDKNNEDFKNSRFSRANFEGTAGDGAEENIENSFHAHSKANTINRQENFGHGYDDIDDDLVNKICDSNSEPSVHRKKSILRYNRSSGGCSVNSFNGSAGGSSIISDGKMGSMNSSFNSQFYNNFYTRAARRNDFQRYTRGPYAPLDRCNSTSASSASQTIQAHYYPEGGWGFVILATATFTHALLCGFLLSGGTFSIKIMEQFGYETRIGTEWLISLSLGFSLLLSPLWVSICKRKSTRLTAVFGGLLTSLGCLFTSFASQFHQLFFSYVIFMGVGVGLTRDASMLMVGQYFKRKRDFVEIFLVAGSGLGILIMSTFMEYAISSVGWRWGLQSVTGSLVITFFLGSCYRSASLYHPQRRAIVHLKNQKRKIKEKEKKNDRPPFLDWSCLTSRSLQMILVSTAFNAWGLYAPLFHLALEFLDEGVDDADRLFIYIYIGAGWIIGCFVFGFLTIQRNEDCRISRLYLCQVCSLIIGISIVALISVKDHSGIVTFAWAYGIGLGGYNYMLKAHTYEKMRARLFPRGWSFIQGVQGAAILFGIPVTGYINNSFGPRTGYYVSAGSIFLGFLIMFLSAVGNRGLTRHKSSRSSMKTCETTDSIQSPGLRRISFTFPDEQMSPPRISKENRSSCSERSRSSHSEQPMMPKELTRISEEGILDTNH